MDYLQVGNSSLLGIAVSILLIMVAFQTIIMIKKGWNEAIRLGVDKVTLKLIVKNSVTISILPTLPVLIVLFILVPLLGQYLPWLRLSVIGSGTFEMLSADLGAQAAGLTGLVAQGFTVEAFVNAAWCMSIAGSIPLLVSGLFLRPIFSIYDKIRHKDTELMKIIASMAMLSLIMSLSLNQFSNGSTAITVIVVCLIVSIICQKLAIKHNIKALDDFIMPLILIFGLILSYFLGNFIFI